MPKKKQFINKNAPGTHTFQIVHRSQRDPRLGDGGSSSFVLQPVVPLNVQRKQQDGGERSYMDASEALRHIERDNDAIEEDEDDIKDPALKKKEQLAQLGVYYDDDYDYMQHLRETGGANAERIEADQETMQSLLAQFGDPEDALASDQPASSSSIANLIPAEALAPDERDLFDANQTLDPRFDMDPEVVAALDDALDFEDPNNILDDDFIAQAQASEDEWCPDDDDDDDAATPTPGDFPNYQSGLEAGNLDGDAQWRMIGHGAPPARFGGRRSPDSMSAGSRESLEDVKSRFTEYSMTSSILPRSEHQQFQDDHFEKMYEQYDDEQLGALDEDHELEDEEVVGNADVMAFEGVLDSFLESQATRKLHMNDVPTVEDDVGEIMDAATLTAHVTGIEDEEATEQTMLEAIPYKDKRGKEWDCESILSTRSTLYNHPTVIRERQVRKVKIHAKAGFPLEAFDRDDNPEADDQDLDDEEYVPEANLGERRNKQESAEEKRQRKAAVKAERRQRREAKKANKEAFKAEHSRQLRQSGGSSLNTMSLTSK